MIIQPKSFFVTKVCALLLALAFLLPSLSWAFEPGTYPAASTPFPQVRFGDKTLAVPEKYGAIIRGFAGNDKAVISIQDLHCNYEVQKNIAGLLEYLEKTYGLKLIGEEGASGTVNLGVLREFPLKAIRQEVSDYYVKQGKLTGAEYFAANAGPAVKLEGIEDPKTYQASLENVRLFLNTETQGYICDLREALEALKPALYSAELGKLDAARRAYREGKLDLLRYAHNLQAWAEVLGLPSGDQTTGRDPEQMLIASEHTEMLMRERFYTRPEQRELDELGRRLDVMEKLLSISATPEELEQFRINRREYAVQPFVEFIRRHAPAGGVQEDEALQGLDQSLLQAEGFYQLADLRSEQFVENVLRQMARKGQSLSVILNGGFHGEKIFEELKKRNITCLSIQPQVTRPDRVNPYFSLLQGKKLPIEKLLEKNQNILAVRSWPQTPGFAPVMEMILKPIAAAAWPHLNTDQRQAAEKFLAGHKVISLTALNGAQFGRQLPAGCRAFQAGIRGDSEPRAILVAEQVTLTPALEKLVTRLQGLINIFGKQTLLLLPDLAAARQVVEKMPARDDWPQRWKRWFNRGQKTAVSAGIGMAASVRSLHALGRQSAVAWSQRRDGFGQEGRLQAGALLKEQGYFLPAGLMAFLASCCMATFSLNGPPQMAAGLLAGAIGLTVFYRPFLGIHHHLLPWARWLFGITPEAYRATLKRRYWAIGLASIFAFSLFQEPLSALVVGQLAGLALHGLTNLLLPVPASSVLQIPAEVQEANAKVLRDLGLTNEQYQLLKKSQLDFEKALLRGNPALRMYIASLRTEQAFSHTLLETVRRLRSQGDNLALEHALQFAIAQHYRGLAGESWGTGWDNLVLDHFKPFLTGVRLHPKIQEQLTGTGTAELLTEFVHYALAAKEAVMFDIGRGSDARFMAHLNTAVQKQKVHLSVMWSHPATEERQLLGHMVQKSGTGQLVFGYGELLRELRNAQAEQESADRTGRAAQKHIVLVKNVEAIDSEVRGLLQEAVRLREFTHPDLGVIPFSDNFQLMFTKQMETSLEDESFYDRLIIKRLKQNPLPDPEPDFGWPKQANEGNYADFLRLERQKDKMVLRLPNRAGITLDPERFGDLGLPLRGADVISEVFKRAGLVLDFDTTRMLSAMQRCTDERKKILRIEGPTGVGKTFAAQGFGALRGASFASHPASAGMDLNDLICHVAPDDQGVIQYDPDTVLKQTLEQRNQSGEGGIVALSELNTLLDLREKVSAAWWLVQFSEITPDEHGVTHVRLTEVPTPQGKEVPEILMPPGALIVVDTNPAGDYAVRGVFPDVFSEYVPSLAVKDFISADPRRKQHEDAKILLHSRMYLQPGGKLVVSEGLAGKLQACYCEVARAHLSKQFGRSEKTLFSARELKRMAEDVLAAVAQGKSEDEALASAARNHLIERWPDPADQASVRQLLLERVFNGQDRSAGVLNALERPITLAEFILDQGCAKGRPVNVRVDPQTDLNPALAALEANSQIKCKTIPITGATDRFTLEGGKISTAQGVKEGKGILGRLADEARAHPDQTVVYFFDNLHNMRPEEAVALNEVQQSREFHPRGKKEAEKLPPNAILAGISRAALAWSAAEQSRYVVYGYAEDWRGLTVSHLQPALTARGVPSAIGENMNSLIGSAYGALQAAWSDSEARKPRLSNKKFAGYLQTLARAIRNAPPHSLNEAGLYELAEYWFGRFYFSAVDPEQVKKQLANYWRNKSIFQLAGRWREQDSGPEHPAQDWPASPLVKEMSALQVKFLKKADWHKETLAAILSNYAAQLVWKQRPRQEAKPGDIGQGWVPRAFPGRKILGKSDDGQAMLARDDTSGEVRVYRWNDELKDFPEPGERLGDATHGAGISPDGRVTYRLDANGGVYVQVWDGKKYQNQDVPIRQDAAGWKRKVLAQEAPLYFSGDSQIIAEANENAELRVYAWDEKKYAFLPLGKSLGVSHKAVISQDGSFLARLNGDGRYCLHARQGAEYSRELILPKSVAGVRFQGPDHAVLTENNDGSMSLYYTRAGEPAGLLPPMAGKVSAWLKKNISGAVQKTFQRGRARDLKSSGVGQGWMRLDLPAGSELMSVSADRRVIVYRGADNRVYVHRWQAKHEAYAVRGECLGEMQPSIFSLMGKTEPFAVSQNGRVIIMIDNQGRAHAHVWDDHQKQYRETGQDSGDATFGAWLSPDSQTLVLRDKNGAAHLHAWDGKIFAEKGAVAKVEKVQPKDKFILLTLNGGKELVYRPGRFALTDSETGVDAASGRAFAARDLPGQIGILDLAASAREPGQYINQALLEGLKANDKSAQAAAWSDIGEKLQRFENALPWKNENIAELKKNDLGRTWLPRNIKAQEIAAISDDGLVLVTRDPLYNCYAYHWDENLQDYSTDGQALGNNASAGHNPYISPDGNLINLFARYGGSWKWDEGKKVFVEISDDDFYQANKRFNEFVPVFKMDSRTSELCRYAYDPKTYHAEKLGEPLGNAKNGYACSEHGDRVVRVDQQCQAHVHIWDDKQKIYVAGPDLPVPKAEKVWMSKSGQVVVIRGENRQALPLRWNPAQGGYAPCKPLGDVYDSLSISADGNVIAVVRDTIDIALVYVWDGKEYRQETVLGDAGAVRMDASGQVIGLTCSGSSAVFRRGFFMMQDNHTALNLAAQKPMKARTLPKQVSCLKFEMKEPAPVPLTPGAGLQRSFRPVYGQKPYYFMADQQGKVWLNFKGKLLPTRHELLAPKDRQAKPAAGETEKIVVPLSAVRHPYSEEPKSLTEDDLLMETPDLERVEEAVLDFFQTGWHVDLEGRPGGGKTSISRELALLLGLPQYLFQSHGERELSDLIGGFQEDSNGNLILSAAQTYRDASGRTRYVVPLLDLLVNGGVYIYDEGPIGQQGRDLLNWLSPILQGRKKIYIEDFPGHSIELAVSPDFHLLLTNNLPEETKARVIAAPEVAGNMQYVNVSEDDQPDILKRLFQRFLGPDTGLNAEQQQRLAWIVAEVYWQLKPRIGKDLGKDKKDRHYISKREVRRIARLVAAHCRQHPGGDGQYATYLGMRLFFEAMFPHPGERQIVHNFIRKVMKSEQKEKTPFQRMLDEIPYAPGFAPLKNAKDEFLDSLESRLQAEIQEQYGSAATEHEAWVSYLTDVLLEQNEPVLYIAEPGSRTGAMLENTRRRRGASLEIIDATPEDSKLEILGGRLPVFDRLPAANEKASHFEAGRITSYLVTLKGKQQLEKQAAKPQEVLVWIRNSDQWSEDIRTALNGLKEDRYIDLEVEEGRTQRFYLPGHVKFVDELGTGSVEEFSSAAYNRHAKIGVSQETPVSVEQDGRGYMSDFEQALLNAYGLDNQEAEWLTQLYQRVLDLEKPQAGEAGWARNAKYHYSPTIFYVAAMAIQQAKQESPEWQRLLREIALTRARSGYDPRQHPAQAPPADQAAQAVHAKYQNLIREIFIRETLGTVAGRLQNDRRFTDIPDSERFRILLARVLNLEQLPDTEPILHFRPDGVLDRIDDIPMQPLAGAKAPWNISRRHRVHYNPEAVKALRVLARAASLGLGRVVAFCGEPGAIKTTIVGHFQELTGLGSDLYKYQTHAGSEGTDLTITLEQADNGAFRKNRKPFYRLIQQGQAVIDVDEPNFRPRVLWPLEPVLRAEARVFSNFPGEPPFTRQAKSVVALTYNPLRLSGRHEIDRRLLDQTIETQLSPPDEDGQLEILDSFYGIWTPPAGKLTTQAEPAGEVAPEVATGVVPDIGGKARVRNAHIRDVTKKRAYFGDREMGGEASWLNMQGEVVSPISAADAARAKNQEPVHGVFDPELYPNTRHNVMNTLKIDGHSIGLIGPEQPDEIMPISAHREADLATDHDFFNGSLEIDKLDSHWQPLPSAGAGMQVLTARFFAQQNPEVPLPLEFGKDAADNYYVRAPGKTSVAGTLHYRVAVPDKYFAYPIPKIPFAYAQDIPGPVQEAMAIIGLTGQETDFQEVVFKLTSFFRSKISRVEDIDGNESQPPFLDIVKSERGVCRHRAFAFVVTALGIGLRARYVTTDQHAYPEIKVPGVGWIRLGEEGLGGGGDPSNRNLSSLASRRHQAKYGDNLPQPKTFASEGRLWAERTLAAMAAQGIEPQTSIRSGGQAQGQRAQTLSADRETRDERIKQALEGFKAELKADISVKDELSSYFLHGRGDTDFIFNRMLHACRSKQQSVTRLVRAGMGEIDVRAHALHLPKRIKHKTRLVQFKRTAAAIIFDSSGSRHGARHEMAYVFGAMQNLWKLREVLPEYFFYSLSLFSDLPYTVVKMGQHYDESEHENLLKGMANKMGDGGTDICLALEENLETFLSTKEAAGALVKYVILFTDGNDSRAITNGQFTEEFRELMHKYQEAGIDVIAIGVGQGAEDVRAFEENDLQHFIRIEPGHTSDIAEAIAKVSEHKLLGSGMLRRGDITGFLQIGTGTEAAAGNIRAVHLLGQGLFLGLMLAGAAWLLPGLFEQSWFQVLMGGFGTALAGKGLALLRAGRQQITVQAELESANPFARAHAWTHLAYAGLDRQLLEILPPAMKADWQQRGLVRGPAGAEHTFLQFPRSLPYAELLLLHWLDLFLVIPAALWLGGTALRAAVRLKYAGAGILRMSGPWKLLPVLLLARGAGRLEGESLIDHIFAQADPRNQIVLQGICRLMQMKKTGESFSRLDIRKQYEDKSLGERAVFFLEDKQHPLIEKASGHGQRVWAQELEALRPLFLAWAQKETTGSLEPKEIQNRIQALGPEARELARDLQPLLASARQSEAELAKTVHYLFKRAGKYPGLAQAGLDPAFPWLILKFAELPVTPEKPAEPQAVEGPDTKALQELANKYDPERQFGLQPGKLQPWLDTARLFLHPDFPPKEQERMAFIRAISRELSRPGLDSAGLAQDLAGLAAGPEKVRAAGDQEEAARRIIIDQGLIHLSTAWGLHPELGPEDKAALQDSLVVKANDPLTDQENANPLPAFLRRLAESGVDLPDMLLDCQGEPEALCRKLAPYLKEEWSLLAVDGKINRRAQLLFNLIFQAWTYVLIGRIRKNREAGVYPFLPTRFLEGVNRLAGGVLLYAWLRADRQAAGQQDMWAITPLDWHARLAGKPENLSLIRRELNAAAAAKRLLHLASGPDIYLHPTIRKIIDQRGAVIRSLEPGTELALQPPALSLLKAMEHWKPGQLLQEYLQYLEYYLHPAFPLGMYEYWMLIHSIQIGVVRSLAVRLGLAKDEADLPNFRYQMWGYALACGLISYAGALAKRKAEKVPADTDAGTRPWYSAPDFESEEPAIAVAAGQYDKANFIGAAGLKPAAYAENTPALAGLYAVAERHFQTASDIVLTEAQRPFLNRHLWPKRSGLESATTQFMEVIEKNKVDLVGILLQHQDQPKALVQALLPYIWPGIAEKNFEQYSKEEYIQASTVVGLLCTGLRIARLAKFKQTERRQSWEQAGWVPQYALQDMGFKARPFNLFVLLEVWPGLEKRIPLELQATARVRQIMLQVEGRMELVKFGGDAKRQKVNQADFGRRWQMIRRHEPGFARQIADMRKKADRELEEVRLALEQKEYNAAAAAAVCSDKLNFQKRLAELKILDSNFEVRADLVPALKRWAKSYAWQEQIMRQHPPEALLDLYYQITPSAVRPTDVQAALAPLLAMAETIIGRYPELKAERAIYARVRTAMLHYAGDLPAVRKSLPDIDPQRITPCHQALLKTDEEYSSQLQAAIQEKERQAEALAGKEQRTKENQVKMAAHEKMLAAEAAVQELLGPLFPDLEKNYPAFCAAAAGLDETLWDAKKITLEQGRQMQEMLAPFDLKELGDFLQMLSSGPTGLSDLQPQALHLARFLAYVKIKARPEMIGSRLGWKSHILETMALHARKNSWLKTGDSLGELTPEGNKTLKYLVVDTGVKSKDRQRLLDQCQWQDTAWDFRLIPGWLNAADLQKRYVRRRQQMEQAAQAEENTGQSILTAAERLALKMYQQPGAGQKQVLSPSEMTFLEWLGAALTVPCLGGLEASKGKIDLTALRTELRENGALQKYFKSRLPNKRGSIEEALDAELLETMVSSAGDRDLYRILERQINRADLPVIKAFIHKQTTRLSPAEQRFVNTQMLSLVLPQTFRSFTHGWTQVEADDLIYRLIPALREMPGEFLSADPDGFPFNLQAAKDLVYYFLAQRQILDRNLVSPEEMAVLPEGLAAMTAEEILGELPPSSEPDRRSKVIGEISAYFLSAHGLRKNPEKPKIIEMFTALQSQPMDPMMAKAVAAQREIVGLLQSLGFDGDVSEKITAAMLRTSPLLLPDERQKAQEARRGLMKNGAITMADMQHVVQAVPLKKLLIYSDWYYHILNFLIYLQSIWKTVNPGNKMTAADLMNLYQHELKTAEQDLPGRNPASPSSTRPADAGGIMPWLRAWWVKRGLEKYQEKAGGSGVGPQALAAERSRLEAQYQRWAWVIETLPLSAGGLAGAVAVAAYTGFLDPTTWTAAFLLTAVRLGWALFPFEHLLPTSLPSRQDLQKAWRGQDYRGLVKTAYRHFKPTDWTNVRIAFGLAALNIVLSFAPVPLAGVLVFGLFSHWLVNRILRDAELDKKPDQLRSLKDLLGEGKINEPLFQNHFLGEVVFQFKHQIFGPRFDLLNNVRIRLGAGFQAGYQEMSAGHRPGVDELPAADAAFVITIPAIFKGVLAAPVPAGRPGRMWQGLQILLVRSLISFKLHSYAAETRRLLTTGNEEDQATLLEYAGREVMHVSGRLLAGLGGQVRVADYYAPQGGRRLGVGNAEMWAVLELCRQESRTNALTLWDAIQPRLRELLAEGQAPSADKLVQALMQTRQNSVADPSLRITVENLQAGLQSVRALAENAGEPERLRLETNHIAALIIRSRQASVAPAALAALQAAPAAGAQDQVQWLLTAEQRASLRQAAATLMTGLPGNSVWKPVLADMADLAGQETLTPARSARLLQILAAWSLPQDRIAALAVGEDVSGFAGSLVNGRADVVRLGEPGQDVEAAKPVVANILAAEAGLIENLNQGELPERVVKVIPYAGELTEILAARGNFQRDAAGYLGRTALARHLTDTSALAQAYYRWCGHRARPQAEALARVLIRMAKHEAGKFQADRSLEAGYAQVLAGMDSLFHHSRLFPRSRVLGEVEGRPVHVPGALRRGGVLGLIWLWQQAPGNFELNPNTEEELQRERLRNFRMNSAA